MYFTVNVPILIEGRPFRPCVCYAISSTAMDLTVNKLVAEGKATKHEKFVFFCNGKPVEQKAEKHEAISIPRPKNKAKTKKAEPKDFAKEAEEIVTAVEPDVDIATEDF